MFTCGPASVKAVRKGELYYGFHSKFLFAEAHGERVHWLVDADGNMTAFRAERRVVGRQISTKAAGTISRLDITDLYKPPDGKLVFVILLGTPGREKKACSLGNP